MRRGPRAFENHNSFRRLDWRRHWAERHVEGERRKGWKIDDDDLAVAIRFLRAQKRCRDDQARERHQRRWPALIVAHQLANQDSPLRWEVKARILAGQTDEEIGAACELHPEVVYWFECLFFNVRDRLQGRDWIAIQVLGGGCLSPWSLEDPERICMCFGFMGGPHVIPLAMLATTLLRQAGDCVFTMPLDETVLKCARAIRLRTLPLDAPVPAYLLSGPEQAERRAAPTIPTSPAVDSTIMSAPVTDLVAEGKTAKENLRKAPPEQAG